jgi:hypothetical protein
MIIFFLDADREFAQASEMNYVILAEEVISSEVNILPLRQR